MYCKSLGGGRYRAPYGAKNSVESLQLWFMATINFCYVQEERQKLTWGESLARWILKNQLWLKLFPGQTETFRQSALMICWPINSKTCVAVQLLLGKCCSAFFCNVQYHVQFCWNMGAFLYLQMPTYIDTLYGNFNCIVSLQNCQYPPAILRNNIKMHKHFLVKPHLYSRSFENKRIRSHRVTWL